MKQKALHEASTSGFTLLFGMTGGSSFCPSPSILSHSFSTSNLETVGSIISHTSELYRLNPCQNIYYSTFLEWNTCCVLTANYLLIPFPIVSWQGMCYWTSFSPSSRSLSWHNRLISVFFSNCQMHMVETSTCQCAGRNQFYLNWKWTVGPSYWRYIVILYMIEQCLLLQWSLNLFGYFLPFLQITSFFFFLTLINFIINF